MPIARRVWCVLFAVLLLALPVRGQAPGVQALPPELLLGRRAEMVRQTIPTIPIVVIAKSPAAYLQMIAQWSLNGRFPVLLDDGSDVAAEHIARFVRGFGPERVLVADGQDDQGRPMTLPEEAEARKTLIEGAAHRAWGAESADQLRAIWERTQFTPPGAVVASIDDPAWTAAVALAAGRGQPIVWLDLQPQSPSGFVDAKVLDALAGTIEAMLDENESSWTWRELGDDLDALALCVSQPTKFRRDGEILAVTDRLGRHADDERWGWCGMIFGDEATSAYRAMSSLFIQSKSAWLFDGYREDFAPSYAIEPAAALLEEAGFRQATNFPPRGGLDAWRARAEGGVKAGLILVNTQGFARWFMLTPGRARSSDVPYLHSPAAVVFTHSFSAQRVADGDTIAGRWLERGAFVYYGSCDEPTLGGFVPNHMVVGRLLAGGALGASVRHASGRGGRLWKLNYIGDPLFTLGAPAPRTEDIPDLVGASPLEDSMRTALSARDLERGARSLLLLGRDADVVRLARAALSQGQAEGEGAMSPALAGLAIPAALRANDSGLVVELFTVLRDEPALARRHRDALWHAARPLLERRDVDTELVELLQLAIRPESADDDASALATHLSRVQGKSAVRAMYSRLIGATTDREVRQWLEEALRSW